MNKYNRFLLHASFYHAKSVCFKSVIQSGRSLFLSKIKNISLKLPVGVSPLQLVNLHRNRRYFVMVLSIIFLEDKHKIVLHLSIFYEYQVFSTPYLFLDTAARLLWPVTHYSTFYQFFFLIMLFNNIFKPAFQIFFQTGTMILPNKFRVSTFNKLQLLSLYFYV